MGTLIEYVQDKNSHFYLCQCKTSIGLYEYIVITFHKSLDEVSSCCARSLHIPFLQVPPRQLSPRQLLLTKVVEWNGNEILGAHSGMSPTLCMKRIGMEDKEDEDEDKDTLVKSTLYQILKTRNKNYLKLKTLIQLKMQDEDEVFILSLFS
ncbi:hypothetical protein ACJIZ3_023812 [Penstemon smallii]|uniref:Uncharacterized protein n=1 Tax=Penstemon smallii TaxID=265156 RepID=A0ABD3TRK0_9LAMI